MSAHYLIAWGLVSDPTNWKTYQYEHGLDSTDDTITTHPEKHVENNSVHNINLSDWINYYAAEGYEIFKEIQHQDNLMIILER